MIIEAPPQSGLASCALRPLRRADVAQWYGSLPIPEVIEHTSWDLRGCEDLQERVRQYEAPDPQSALRFGILEGSRACLAGTIGFHSESRTHRGAELAYDLAPRDSGRGIATAACAAVTG